MATCRDSIWNYNRLQGIDNYAEGYDPFDHNEARRRKPLFPAWEAERKAKMQETTTQPVPYEPKPVVNIEDYAMTPDKVLRQVQLIQQVMDKAMQENEHFGKIPGTNKPTLLKAGAEKLCMTFRLDPDYAIIREIRESDFIAYTVKCDLKHITSGQAIASGIGSCNSRETKYRWRNIEKPLTPLKEVPKSYWKDRNKQVLGGKDYKPWKNPEDGKWYVALVHKVENDNPWDLDNTLIKMACKRALVAATLNATAASDIFTQDLEDMQDNGVAPKEAKPIKKPANKKKPASEQPEDPGPSPTGPMEEVPAWVAHLNATKKAKLYHVAGINGMEETELEAMCKTYANGQPFNNEMAGELINNFEDAVVNYRAGNL